MKLDVIIPCYNEEGNILILNDKIKELEEQIKNLEANCLEDYKEFTAFQNGLFYIRLKKDEKIYYPK